MKCDELKQVEYPIEWGLYYDKSEVDEAIAELKARIQLDDDEMAGFLDLEEECGGSDLRNYIAELKRELEDAKATHYAEKVYTNMEVRRLRRALYKACANWACAKMEYAQFDSNMFMCGLITDKEVSWEAMMKKCLKKVEEYK